MFRLLTESTLCFWPGSTKVLRSFSKLDSLESYYTVKGEMGFAKIFS
jgi:hypothetical protein